MTPLTFAAPLRWWEVNTTLHRHELKASFWTTAGAVTKEDRSKNRYQFNSSATQFTEEWKCAGRSKELIAWVLREVFRQSAWCPLANPQSPSSPFQQGKIQKGQIQNCVRTFLPDGRETVAEQYTTEVLTMHCNILSPLPVCTCVCASPSPLAPSATLHLPPESSLSPFAYKRPLLFRASSCSFTDACSFLFAREWACFNTKQREAGAECGVMSSKCCECSLAVVQQCICMSANVLSLYWPIKTTLPVSSTAILMRHPWLQ